MSTNQLSLTRNAWGLRREVRGEDEQPVYVEYLGGTGPAGSGRRSRRGAIAACRAVGACVASIFVVLSVGPGVPPAGPV